MFRVSNSKLNLWRRCHYQYYLKYVLRLVKKVKPGALRRGSIIHECIEAYNNGKSWKKVYQKFADDFYKNTFMEELIEVGDIPKMVKELLENYFYYYADEDLEYIANELHFILPLTKSIEIEGYIDGVVGDNKDRIWAKETKSYGRSPSRDLLVFNPQSGIYTWALKELGYNAHGTMWDIIKAKQPSVPKLLKPDKKTGEAKLSLAKLDSTPYSVKKGIINLGFDPHEYKDFINRHRFEDFLYRPQVRVNKKIIKTIMGDTISTAKEIKKYGGVNKDRNLTKDCGWCSYKDICYAELMNLDTDYIIKRHYEVREKRG